MNKKKLIVGGMVGVIAIGVVGVGISNASSLGYQTEIGLGFTFNPSITVSISGDLSINELTPGNYADSNIVTIGVVTNAVNGYILQATTGTNSTDNRLVNTENSNYYFTSLGTNETVTSMNGANDNTWGYSYSTDNGTTWISSPGTLGYSGLPQDANTTAAERGSGGKTLIDTNDSASNQSVKFKIGAKAASNQASGEYTNTVNFYAVTYPEPEPEPPISQCTTPAPGGITYMQEVTSSNISTIMGQMEAGAQYYLRDRRDETPYCITKIESTDSSSNSTTALWMTQNLRIQGTISAADSNFTGSDFNVSQYDLKTNGGSGGECSVNGRNNVCSHIPDSADLATINTDGRNYTAEQIGAWYNYAAASAGTIMGNTNSTEATSDICPAGWRMPNYDAAESAGSNNSLFGSTFVSQFMPVTGGRYYGNSPFNTDFGYWGSTTASSTSIRYNLAYSGGSLSSRALDRYNGFYIRCVASQ